mmetsp:Transcript_10233/g.22114  ORF Transcript_10233/g.22114 Transcript_10233/m.22114 type:complete len:268 (+) Transcript_10233:1166-1969(+)
MHVQVGRLGIKHVDLKGGVVLLRLSHNDQCVPVEDFDIIGIFFILVLLVIILKKIGVVHRHVLQVFNRVPSSFNINFAPSADAKGLQSLHVERHVLAGVGNICKVVLVLAVAAFILTFVVCTAFDVEFSSHHFGILSYQQTANVLLFVAISFVVVRIFVHPQVGGQAGRIDLGQLQFFIAAALFFFLLHIIPLFVVRSIGITGSLALILFILPVTATARIVTLVGYVARLHSLQKILLGAGVFVFTGSGVGPSRRDPLYGRYHVAAR